MRKMVYYISIALSAVSGLLLLGLAGAADNASPIQWIIPRAVIALVCMVIFAGVAHITKMLKKEPREKSRGLFFCRLPSKFLQQLDELNLQIAAKFCIERLHQHYHILPFLRGSVARIDIACCNLAGHGLP